jgi:phosphate transport system substrate-binding protein
MTTSRLDPVRAARFALPFALLATPALAAGLSGTVKIDGSSTVFPITEAVAEEFQGANKDVRVTVGVSGTGGGYKKFVAGEIDVANASRPIKAEEIAKATEGKIEFLELPVAYDGLAVVVNPKNTWVKTLTKVQLKRLWEPSSGVKTWKDLDATWPDEPIKLYGPGADSGTFDYFTEEVVGKSKASRSDYTASEDDNVLVNGIAGDKNALGYFGFAYYAENKAKLKDVPIDGGKGAVSPDDGSIRSGKYPLSRPLFIAVNKASLARSEVEAFVAFYLKHAKTLAHEVGYTGLPDALAAEVQKRFEARQTGPWTANATH